MDGHEHRLRLRLSLFPYHRYGYLVVLRRCMLESRYSLLLAQHKGKVKLPRGIRAQGALDGRFMVHTEVTAWGYGVAHQDIRHWLERHGANSSRQLKGIAKGIGMREGGEVYLERLAFVGLHPYRCHSFAI